MPKISKKEHVTTAGVVIPLAAIIAAFPRAVAAAKASASDNEEAASPGGVKTTVGEVVEDAGEFFKVLLEAAVPAIIRANGL